MANDYGSSDGVAALIPRWASGSGDSADFTVSTSPTLTQVTTWLEQVGDILNAHLETAGFVTPITDTEAKNICDIFVNQEVASIVEGVHGSGRFGPPGRNQRGTPKGRFALLLEDVTMFIETNAKGLKRLGANRDQSNVGQIVTRDTDQAGDSVPPLFERKAFGNQAKEWDS